MPIGSPTPDSTQGGEAPQYLARYTHRVAISNHRLQGLEEDRVVFEWKDYRDEGKVKVMRLEAVEFLRRFLLHVLPARFYRFRYYGLLANRYRAVNLERCRELLGVADEPEPEAETAAQDEASPSESWQEHLEAVEFLRRFLLHVLPARFYRFRYYGLLGQSISRSEPGALS